MRDFEVSGRVKYVRRLSDGNALVQIVTKTGKITELTVLTKSGDWEKLREKDRVYAKGHIEYYHYSTGGKEKKRLSYVVDNISHEKTLTEKYFGIKGRFYADMFSRAYISGKVVRTEKNNDWIYYYIALDGKDNVRLSQKVRDHSRIYKEGDCVVCVCEVSVTEKDINGKKVHFENFIVTDIALDNREREDAQVDVEPIF